MMTYRISKRFAFCASHQLGHLPEGHQCARLHGHNYTVTIWLCGMHLNQSGFVRDYGELKHFQRLIDEKLDHRHLNEVLTEETTGVKGFVTSAEHLAAFLLRVAICLYGDLVTRVEVSETEKTTASAEWGTTAPTSSYRSKPEWTAALAWSSL